jgi:autotransporter-associated beta strand protein
MMTLTPRKTLAWAAACAVVTASALQAQTVSIYTRGGTNDTWTNTANWDTAFFPNAPDALAQFSQAVETDRINMLMTSTALAVPNVHQTAGILVLESFVANLAPDGNFLFRNSSGGTTGMLRLHGFDTTINGNPATGLVANFSEQDISFSTANASFQIQLAGSGYFHVEKPGVQTRVIVGITETEGSHGIVKTGAGLLHFGAESANSNFSGGFTMEEGIVQWTSSGGASANPFGTGPLTLRGGNLRSTTNTGRSLNTSIVLDGGAEFGSQDETFNGAIAVNSGGGSHTSSIISDSTLTVHSTVNWHQATSGAFGLTKEGAGTLILTGTGGNAAHEGSTIVEAGTLLVNTAITDSAVTVRAGATLGFGTASAVGLGAFGSSLTLESGSTLAFELAAFDSFDSILANGVVSLDGAILDITLGFTPDFNDVFLLIDNQSGQALNGLLSYGGNTLSEGSEFAVTTGEFSQLFAISYLAGDGNSLALTAIPEPSTWALIIGIAVLGAAGFRRRRGSAV